METNGGQRFYIQSTYSSLTGYKIFKNKSEEKRNNSIMSVKNKKGKILTGGTNKGNSSSNGTFLKKLSGRVAVFDF